MILSFPACRSVAGGGAPSPSTSHTPTRLAWSLFFFLWRLLRFVRAAVRPRRRRHSRLRSPDWPRGVAGSYPSPSLRSSGAQSPLRSSPQSGRPGHRPTSSRYPGRPDCGWLARYRFCGAEPAIGLRSTPEFRFGLRLLCQPGHGGPSPCPGRRAGASAKFLRSAPGHAADTPCLCFLSLLFCPFHF